MSVPTPLSSVVFDETDVRRLCGDGAFAQADRFQRAGHVLGPELRGNALVATVRGTWRRVDQATVTAQSGRLEPSCPCKGGDWCRHVGALLLHWLRNPNSFAAAQSTPGATAVPPLPDAGATGPSPEPSVETPQDELVRFLDQHNLASLREIARRRGVPTSARSKADLVVQLARALAAPESVDAAIARLGREERLTLDGAHLVQALGAVAAETIRTGYRALGGALPVAPLEALLDLALVMPAPRTAYAAASYSIPRAVAARLPTLRGLVRAVEGGALERDARGEWADDRAAGPEAPRLSIEEVLQVIALAVSDGMLRRRSVAPVESPIGSFVPAGWEFHPADLPGLGDLDWYYRKREVRLLPAPPLVEADDLKRLATQTGQSASAVAFVVDLMVALGLIEGVGRLAVREDRVQRLFDLSPAARMAKLVHAWLAMGNRTELTMVVGDDKPFQLRCRPTLTAGLPVLHPQTAATRRLLARLIGRLPAETRFDTESLLATFLGLGVPTLSPTPGFSAGRQAIWWLIDRSHHDEMLAVDTTAGWKRFGRALVVACLVGPLSWLGLVDVAPNRSQPNTFRVRPMAAVLAGREPPDGPETAAPPLVVEPDLMVLAPAGTSDPALHALLAQVGALADVTRAGLRYRLTAERVQGFFDAGGTGPGLVRFLSERSGGRLPEAARTKIERWWAGYGAVRLYDELTLIELGDDFLLPELLAASSLGGSLVHTFSPRLIAVESAAVESIVADLTRLGHAPRVVEDPL